MAKLSQLEKASALQVAIAKLKAQKQKAHTRKPKRAQPTEAIGFSNERNDFVVKSPSTAATKPA